MEKKERLSDLTTSRIQEDILKGKYAVGEKLPTEKELMEIYQVGRSTIREAVKQLSISKILSVKQGSGTYVNKSQVLSPSDILKKAKFDEINDARRLVEGELIQRACQTATQKQLEAIDKSLQEKKKAILEENKDSCIQADIEFHLNVAKAANHQVLLLLYQRFTEMITDFFHEREPKGISFFAMSYHLHEQLYLAIRDKKEKQAAKILDNILNNNFSL
ncbi:transcriptional regulator [Elizabethkingia miricola]|uniref:Transcriptional regulator n=1 Tax=Elizabethkingia miricola TaxID=172045 RepID=A0ABD4DJS2_ELIMR|nr:MULTISPECIES: GntR family transcriptional regulator [Elizabethkingia]KUY17426.1 transcriptional regulator [Elizabethkingia miricola]MCL1652812.1 GntR family transcriptional regulator [Elizabethkingia miricola]OPC68482.1 transcriptional regulator [Elizabethkingia miricola]OPC75553.1 transcriptional regulator [Elizabethkingia miricola]QCO47989.1 FadR family transcriptional regulator [Elizabethkingia sp. 2-6]